MTRSHQVPGARSGRAAAGPAPPAAGRRPPIGQQDPKGNGSAATPHDTGVLGPSLLSRTGSKPSFLKAKSDSWWVRRRIESLLDPGRPRCERYLLLGSWVWGDAHPEHRTDVRELGSRGGRGGRTGPLPGAQRPRPAPSAPTLTSQAAVSAVGSRKDASRRNFNTRAPPPELQKDACATTGPFEDALAADRDAGPAPRTLRPA